MKAHLIVQAIVALVCAVADADGYQWIMSGLGWFIITEMLLPPYSSK